jgi:hypothetical protein
MYKLVSAHQNRTQNHNKKRVNKSHTILLFGKDKQTNKTNSVVLSPRANYTDWSTATCRRNLVSTFVDRGVSRGQRGVFGKESKQNLIQEELMGKRVNLGNAYYHSVQITPFVLLYDVWNYKNPNIWNYNVACGFVWVWNFVSNTKEGKMTEGEECRLLECDAA